MSAASSSIRMRGSSASFIQETQDTKHLLLEEADVEVVPCPTAVVVDAPSQHQRNDPFYENDTSVIEPYFFDYDKMDRELTRTGRVQCVFLVAVVLISVWHPELLLITWWFFLMLICFIASHCSDRSKQYRRRCTHIAIAESGVYVDEVHEPGSQELMRRLVYKYTDIQKSEVIRMDSCGSVSFQVVLFNNRGFRMLQVDGLIGAQRFVDRVNEMVERVPRDSLETTNETAVVRTLEVI